MRGGGWGIPEAGRLPRRSWGEPGWVALGAWAWGWVKGLAVSLFLLLELFLWFCMLPPRPHQCRARERLGGSSRQLPSHHGAFLSTHWAQPPQGPLWSGLCVRTVALFVLSSTLPPSSQPPLSCVTESTHFAETGQDSDLGFPY